MKKTKSKIDESSEIFILGEPTELLHFLQSAPQLPFTELFFPGVYKEYKTWCPFANHGKKTDENCYRLFQLESEYFRYLKEFLCVVEFLSSYPHQVKSLGGSIQKLEESEMNKESVFFEQNLREVEKTVQILEQEIRGKLSRFSCLETQRLGEAIVCYQSEGYTASVIMAATAVEARLHYLLRKKNIKIYNQYFSNGTLGILIAAFARGEYRGKKIVGLSSINQLLPEQHKPLLELINTYRIFSAHPKVTKLDYSTARVILNLSFLFLLDPVLSLEKKMLGHGH
jgi:hypothetical protein